MRAITVIFSVAQYIYFLHTFTRLVFSLLRATDINMAAITVNFLRLFAAQLQLKAVGATQ